MSYKIKYNTPREILAKWLAENDVGGNWPYHYNKDQQEYWCEKADKLIEFIKSKGIL